MSPLPPPLFGMKNTNLTRYKTDVSEWIVSTHLTQDSFTLNASVMCFHDHVIMEKKKKKENLQKKINKMSKQKPALDKRKQQLVTCIQLATEHVRDQKTDTNPNKKECLQHQVSVSNWVWQEREAWSRDFQSNSRGRNTSNVTWGGQIWCVLQRDGDYWRKICNSVQSISSKFQSHWTRV